MFDNLTEPISATIRIFVSNLGAYNSGVLTGQWWTLPVKDTKKIYQQDRDKFGGVEGYGEEYFISDYEACFHVDPYDNIELLNKLAKSLKENSIDTLDEVYYSLDENEREQVGIDEPIEFDNTAISELAATEGMTAEDIAYAALNGHINKNDEFIRLDGYSNFESLSRSEWMKELNNNADEIIEAYEHQHGIKL